MKTSSRIVADSPTVRRKRLFIGGCVALAATAVAFVTIGAVMWALKQRFVFTNAEVGWIGGMALGGYALAPVLAAPLRTKLGLRGLMRGAWGAHVAGTLLMMSASGFWTLLAGALVIALGNGLVEAVYNPLIAALHPDDKIGRLSRFHAWFPGGMALGGAAAWGLHTMGVGAWAPGLILIPTLGYGALLLTASFPAPAEVRTGASARAMFKTALTTPVMGVLVLTIAVAASVEFGPNRWLPAVLDTGGLPGVLVLAYIGGVMAGVRYAAAPVMRRFAPAGVLLLMALVAGGGLFWLSYAQTLGFVLAAATVFAAGVSCFWPALLGLVAERVPRSGAVGLGLAGAVGMAVAGLGVSPQMGTLADDNAHAHLVARQEAEVLDVMQTVTGVYPSVARKASDAAQDELQQAYEQSQHVLGVYANTTRLPAPATANALRAIAHSQHALATTKIAPIQSIPVRARRALLPAEQYGGRVALRYVVPLAGVLVVLLGILYGYDRRAARARST